MSFRDLGIVYRKELRDLLRDRRTIISMFVVPMIIMPLITMSMGVMAKHAVEKTLAETPRVMILGGDDSPATVAALKKQDNFKFIPAGADYKQLISDKKMDAAVEIPSGFDAALANGTAGSINIYDYQGELKSESAAGELRSFFQDLRSSTVRDRLKLHNLPPELLKPFEIQTANVAPPEKVSGNSLGAIIPYLLLITCLTSSFYPATDLTAGEKERGTMETLLCAPVHRTTLALGKCLVVLSVSLTTLLLMFASDGASLMFALSKGRAMAEAGGLPAALHFSSLAAVFVVMIPMALLFASILLTIGLFARSMKEAQSYIGPLMAIMIMPMMMSLLPGVELTTGTALIPVVNVSLLCKEILSGTYHWGFIAIIFASSCVYAGAALAVAVSMFKRESVIFRA